MSTSKLLVKGTGFGEREPDADRERYNFNPRKGGQAGDCRNQRFFNLAQAATWAFPSKPDSGVSLDSIVEFRVQPGQAARCSCSTRQENERRSPEEIVRKVSCRGPSFCRLQGSKTRGATSRRDAARTFRIESPRKRARTVRQMGIEISRR